MFVTRVATVWLVLVGALSPAGVRAQDVALRDVIDREIKSIWAREKITPPAKAADATFLRRVCLDLVGMIPSYEETTAFLNDDDPKKREKLIDRLLADPRYARQQAQVFDVAMLGRKNRLVEGVVGYRNRGRFRGWLAQQFAANEPFDRIAAKILQAEEDGSQLFFAVYRDTNDMVASVSRFFLATQIQCAKCHDHPFEPWTQKDYHGMAGFFVRTMIVEVPAKPEVANQKGSKYLVGERTLGEALFAIEEVDPKTKKKKTTPIKPKFLSGEELKEPEPPAEYVEPKLKPNELPPRPAFSRRGKFIDWMTAKDNPFFARAAVNRIWAQFMGRGFVHPVDDFNQTNEATDPALLKKIESEFVAREFDVKWLIREIVNTEIYQAADLGDVTDASPRLYERARIRPLSVEELTTSLRIATGLGVDAALKSEPDAQILQYLGEPTDGQGRFQGSLSEHLFLHNGELFRGMCRPNKGNLSETLLSGKEPWEAKVERMFLSVLSRPSSSEERERFVQYLNTNATDAKMTAQRIEDAMWALVSCSEFRFNR